MPRKEQKKKRNWRKADIEDVEEALEDNRLVQKLKRKSGPETVKAKAQNEDDDDALFTVDTSGSGEGLSQKTRRQLAREKLFPAKGPRLGLSAAEELKVEKAERKLATQKPPTSKGKEVFDLWGAPAPTPATGIEPPKKSEFSALRGRKYAPKSVPKTLHEKVGVAPAVLPAHEGQSMNPEVNAYDDLTFTAAAQELERQRESQELDRKIKPMTHELRDAMGTGLADMSEQAKVEKLRELVCKSSVDDGDYEGAGQHVKGRRKSQAQRNKQQKQKVLDEEHAQEVAQRRLEKSVGEVGAILKEMKEEEDLAKQRKAYKQNLQVEKRKLEETQGVVPKRRRLGRTAFTEKALVVPDAEAGAKGMRATSLKGSAIQDRLSSIMRRGLMPAPPEASRSEAVRLSKKKGRLNRSKKHISPLMRESLLNR